MLLPVEILDLIVQHCLWLDLEDAVPCFSNLACSCRLFLRLVKHHLPQLVKRVGEAGCFLPKNNLHQLCLLYRRPTEVKDIPCISVIVVDYKAICNLESTGHTSDFYYCPDTDQVCWRGTKLDTRQAYWTNLAGRRVGYGGGGVVLYEPRGNVDKELLVHSHTGQTRKLYSFSFRNRPTHVYQDELRRWYSERFHPHAVEVKSSCYSTSVSYDKVACTDLWPVTEVHDSTRERAISVSKKLVQAVSSMERNQYLKLLQHLEKELE